MSKGGACAWGGLARALFITEAKEATPGLALYKARTPRTIPVIVLEPIS